MPHFLLIVILSLVTFSTFGQGTVFFDNRSPNSGPARVVTYDYFTGVISSPAGTNWSAQLYSAPGLNQPASSLTAAETRVQFRNGMNIGIVDTRSSSINAFTGAPVDWVVTVTPVAGGPATVQMRAWESRFATFEEAVALGGFYGASPTLYLATTGGGFEIPVMLEGLQPFTIFVPEPSTFALGAFGLLTIFLLRKTRWSGSPP